MRKPKPKIRGGRGLSGMSSGGNGNAPTWMIDCWQSGGLIDPQGNCYKNVQDDEWNFASDNSYGNGGNIMIHIGDCIRDCGAGGSGTHADEPDWRRDCMKGCVEAVMNSPQ